MSIRSGLISITVIICRVPLFSSSLGAKTREFPVSLRIRRALRRRIVGPYVSGAKTIRHNENPAMIKATQKVHFQLTVETNPEMMGDSCGPTVVVLESSERCSCPKIVEYSRPYKMRSLVLLW